MHHLQIERSRIFSGESRLSKRPPGWPTSSNRNTVRDSRMQGRTISGASLAPRAATEEMAATDSEWVVLAEKSRYAFGEPVRPTKAGAFSGRHSRLAKEPSACCLDTGSSESDDLKPLDYAALRGAPASHRTVAEMRDLPDSESFRHRW